MAGSWSDANSHTIYWRHDSVFRILDYIFTKENRSRVEIENPEIRKNLEDVQIKIGVENLEISRNNNDNEENLQTTPATSTGFEIENSGNSENPKSQESSQDAETQTEISHPIRINRTQSA